MERVENPSDLYGLSIDKKSRLVLAIGWRVPSVCLQLADTFAHIRCC